jgi:Carboxypeptidase regulatory-like domain
MKIKLMLLVAFLLGGYCAMAESGEKNKKEDPDVNGTVIDAETGKPLKDVSIIAYNAAKKEKVVISDGTGTYSLIDLKPGTLYKLVFEKDGYKKIVKEKLLFKASEKYLLNIEMAEEEAVFDLMPSPHHFSDGD